LGSEPLEPLDLSPDGRYILAARYQQEPTGVYRQTQLLSIELTTGDLSLLVEAEPAESLGPALWSPDGMMIAYRKTTYPVDPAKEFPKNIAEEAICLLDSRGGAIRCFPAPGELYSFDWTGDSQSLVLAGGAATLYVLDVSRGDLSPSVAQQGETPINRAVSEAVGGESFQLVDPRWSPSGRYLAALANLRDSEFSYVPVVFSPGGQPVALGDPSTEFPEPFVWSPGEDVLAYTQGEAPYRITEARLLAPQTGEDRVVVSWDGRDFPIILDLEWSPSGRWLALVLVEEGLRATIRIVDPWNPEQFQDLEIGDAASGADIVDWTA
jgi:hypothetical protein